MIKSIQTVAMICLKSWWFSCGIYFLIPSLGDGQGLGIHPCQCDTVPLHRSEAEEQRVDLNAEFNDYAAIYLDSLNPVCREKAATVLQQKLSDTMAFARSGRKVDSPLGFPLPPFQNWLAGAQVTHLFAAALEFRAHGQELDESLLAEAIRLYAAIPDRQDGECGIPGNTCMDDYALSASGFSWIAAYQVQMGKNARSFLERSQELLRKTFQPMAVSGSICYYVVGSNPLRCDGDPKAVISGAVRIIGTNHGMENPTYGFGLLTAVASTALALSLAQQPFDFSSVEPHSGLSYREISVALLEHARTKSSADGTYFLDSCLDVNTPSVVNLPCRDNLGYTPDMFPLHRFFQSMGYRFEDFPAAGFRFDRFKRDFAGDPPPHPFSRNSFWGANRFTFYNLFGNEVWKGGELNLHYQFRLRSLARNLSSRGGIHRSR